MFGKEDLGVPLGGLKGGWKNIFAIFCKTYGIDITNNGGEKIAH